MHPPNGSKPARATVSSLARLQQWLGMSAWLASVALFKWALDEPAWALPILLAFLLFQPGLIAVQFALSKWINGAKAVDPTFSWAAWWQETCMAARVFGWWQPWGWRVWPDLLPESVSPSPSATALAAGHRGVLLVHGFMCNRGFWTPWLAELHRGQHPFVAVNLEPIMGSIDAYGPTLDEAVRQLTLATGEPPLVVAHSMGGLAVRAWLRHTPGALERVAHVVTLGTPHQGTWLARFGLGANAAQMRQGSAWLAALAQGEGPAVAAKFTCWHSDGDNIVFPLGTAVLPGAQAHHLPGTGHVTLAMAPVVMAQVLGTLRDGMPTFTHPGTCDAPIDPKD